MARIVLVLTCLALAAATTSEATSALREGLGLLYGVGRGPDERVAVQRFAAACKAGERLGCLHEALALARSNDVESETAGIAKLETMCSTQPAACVWLGYLLVRGEYLARDVPRGRVAFDAACAAGERDACEAVRALDQRGALGLDWPTDKPSREHVGAVLASAESKVAGCLEASALERDPCGELVVHAVIDGTGTVVASAIERSSLQLPELHQCILGVFEQLRFPSTTPAWVTEVVYPYVLRTDACPRR